MEEIKKQIIDLLMDSSNTAHSAGSCGELGDSFQALDADYFSDIANDIYDKLIKDLQHHKDTTVGLWAFDKELDKVFEWMPDVNGCKTSVEAYLVEQIEYLKSIVFQIK
jgi:hypothetical protein